MMFEFTDFQVGILVGLLISLAVVVIAMVINK